MTQDVATALTLRERAAEEVRALLGRRRMSGAGLALRIGKSEMYVSRRLRGETPFDLDDLQLIADALNVQPVDLLGGGSTLRYPRPAVKGQVKRSPEPTGPAPAPNTPRRPGGRQPSRPPTAPTTHRRPQLLRHSHPRV